MQLLLYTTLQSRGLASFPGPALLSVTYSTDFFFFCTLAEPGNEATGNLLLSRHLLNSSTICIGCIHKCINFYKLYQQCYIWYDDDVAMHGARKKGQNLLAIDKTLGIRQACQVHWSQPHRL